MAANFLQRDIYVLQIGDEGAGSHSYQKFSATVATKNLMAVDTVNDNQLSLVDCFEELQAANYANPKRPPLVLQFHGLQNSMMLRSAQGEGPPDLVEVSGGADNEQFSYPDNNSLSRAISVPSDASPEPPDNLHSTQVTSLWL
uniref:Uncharacterized protein n=1 Tax=Peronospora matthiolae TaxID=2874970 RepID=A0AAV1VC14_9STRA